jgi:hypothetical protein
MEKVMNIDEAVAKLVKHLDDSEAFTVRHNGSNIIVDVNFIYRVKEVQALGDSWEGFPISTGRRSCW